MDRTTVLNRTFTDTHCHLDFDVFSEDRQETLERAYTAGMAFLLNPGINLETSRSAVHLCTLNKGVFAAIGVHPNDALTWQTDTLEELHKLAKQKGVVAIGEIGLDYYRDRAPRDLQQRTFQEQLVLAAEMNLPVIIHNRQASEDLFNILGKWHQELIRTGNPLGKLPGVLHSFSDSEYYAQRAIEMGFYLGVNGVITYPKAQETRRVIQSLSLGSLLLETDAPFLAPQVHRGKRNEPAFIPFIMEQIAELYDQSVDHIAAITSQNAANLFKWGETL
jgi:TatD DNase family protein